MTRVLLARLAETWQAVAATSARSRKVELLAAVLRETAPVEAAVVVPYLSGELRQRRTGIGWAALRDLPPPAAEPSLTVLDTDATFGRIAALTGPGSQRERHNQLHDLLGRATDAEQGFVAGLITGELRQGALGALVLDAVARATGAPTDAVRGAAMLEGSAAPVAEAVLRDGLQALGRFALAVGRPVQPMLAQPGQDIDDALARITPAAVEWKLDGIRLQVHRDGDDVRIWTRTLDDVTDRLPEIAEAVADLPLRTAILDGEVLALRPGGRPEPFQVTAARTSSRVDVVTARQRTPLSAYFFDLLHLDGADLLTEPGARRHDALAGVVPQRLRVPRLVTSDRGQAAAMLRDALDHGHEGVVVKSLDAPYDAGRRGGAWLKVKPVHTLDLVVLAAEWGHGRRSGWLSNLHLGAPDETGALVMLGKTFKGLTDEMLRWQTARLHELAVERPPWGVVVRPELVVEVAFDGVQTSSRYAGGMALRFARVVRHRPDKPAAQADTIAAVRAVHEPQRGAHRLA